MCSYCSSCLDLPVEVVDFQAKGFPLRLHHVCQYKYAAMNEIDLDGGERKIFRDCVDEIRGRYKSDIPKKVGDRTVYSTYKSYNGGEKMEGTVIGGVGDEVSVITVVYTCGTVSVSSLGYILSFGS